MSENQARAGRVRSHLAIVAAVGLLCAACNSQDSIGSDPNVRSFATATGLRTEVGQPKDFVVRSRPSTVSYVPVEVRPPERAVPRRAAAALPEVEQELDTSRKRSTGFARRSLPKSQYGGVEDARRSVARARALANRPVGVPADQPTSYPVPESRRRGKPTNPLAIPKE
ncbi:MAG: hypothetical protein K2P80_00055 [Beijerinckiaceae bacterium]|nr:hypothetical protein [Beijerinckiaceae bacterium]